MINFEMIIAQNGEKVNGKRYRAIAQFGVKDPKGSDLMIALAKLFEG